MKGQGAVWILLTRHITDKEDFANNREFITVLVYKSNGKRVFYPCRQILFYYKSDTLVHNKERSLLKYCVKIFTDDPPPYRDGIRINSPHYLCKMVEESKGTGTYTLVISQYEKSNTIHYTLRIYSTTEFSLNKISEPYIAKYEKQVKIIVLN